jgi:gliding motility-associated-like protein
MLTVFNRAGQQVYSAAPYQNNWDGKSSGTALQDGDYYYIIQMETGSLKGAVRIIR